MNTAPLNSVTLNGGIFDPVQRSATFIDVVAQVTAGARTYARGLIGTTFTVEADVVASPRMVARGAVTIPVTAEIITSLRRYTTSPVSISPEAVISARGERYPRGLVRDPIAWPIPASLVFDGHVVRRGVVDVQPEASVALSPRSYALVRDPLNWYGKVEFWLQVGTVKRIPYDEDTVPERTMVVSTEDRTVYVS